MNKKGIFIPTLVILSLVVFGFAYYLLILQTPSRNVEKEAGNYVINLANKFDQGKKHEFYIKEAVRMSSNNALYNLAKNGGFNDLKSIADCQTTDDGYVVWKEDCDPTLNLGGNYLSLFRGSFSKYLGKSYLEDIYDYSLEFDDNAFNITLKANKKALFVDSQIEYRLDTSMKHNVNYSLMQFRDINDFLNSKRNCFLEKEKYEECLEDKNWKIVKEDELFKFEVESDRKYLVEEEDGVSFKKIKIKFAKDFKEEDLLNS